MNIYTALRFDNKQHITVRYYPKAECQYLSIAKGLRHIVELTEAMPFVLRFDKEDMFGPKRDIRVLTTIDPMPHWVTHMRNIGTGVIMADRYPFRPHITCDIPVGFDCRITHIAMMCKTEVLQQWELGQSSLFKVGE